MGEFIAIGFYAGLGFTLALCLAIGGGLCFVALKTVLWRCYKKWKDEREERQWQEYIAAWREANNK